MEPAKLSSKGQLTVPLGVRKRLGLKEGDKVLFLDDGEKVFIANASLMALRDFQESMKGEALTQGLDTEDAVNRLVKETRRSIRDK